MHFNVDGIMVKSGKNNHHKQTVADYLIESLKNYGVSHIFGVPGDYILDFFNKLVHTNGINVVTTCDEQGAALAADAYARIKGIGVVCVTYSVGGLKIVNAVAQAFSEKSPLVIISGAPGINKRHGNRFLPHHKVQNFDTQQKIFEHITIDSALIQDPFSATREIDRVLSSAISYKLPVYLELPQDMEELRIVNTDNRNLGNNSFSTPYISSVFGQNLFNETDDEELKEALSESLEMIKSSKKPVIIAGVELHRFGLQDKLLQLVEKTNIPVVSTLLSKSVVNESNTHYLGVYSGNMSKEHVQRYVESSDCVIMIGVFLTNVTFGITDNPIDKSRCIYIAKDNISIKFHNYKNIRFEDFLDGLIKNIENNNLQNSKIYYDNARNDFSPSNTDNHITSKSSTKITVKRLFEILDTSLSENNIVIADVGDSLFGSIDLTSPNSTSFLSPAFYLSMGFAVPASIGAQLANSNFRSIVLVGDGAFQMTGMEVSTIAKLNLNPIIIILNNFGYRTERAILDGPFNDLQMWNYSKIPSVLGKGKGFVVETEEQFTHFLAVAKNSTNDFCLLDVHLDPSDASSALKRLSKELKKKVGQ